MNEPKRSHLFAAAEAKQNKSIYEIVLCMNNGRIVEQLHRSQLWLRLRLRLLWTALLYPVLTRRRGPQSYSAKLEDRCQEAVPVSKPESLALPR